MSKTGFISRTKVIKGADWKPIGLNFSIEAKAVDRALEQQGIDIIEEVLAACRQEALAQAEQNFIQLAKQKATFVATYSQGSIDRDVTFVGELHSVLGELILGAARPTDNIAIVSPTALTILQSAADRNFVRDNTNVYRAPDNTKYVGTIGNLNIYVNQYACDSEPVLIGYVSENEEEREVALLHNHVLGVKENAGEGWLAIGIDTSTLTFF